MIYLIQILKVLPVSELDDFYNLFSDLDSEIIELGYKDNESELISTMLLNHYGLEILDERQLKILTKRILDFRSLASAIRLVKNGI